MFKHDCLDTCCFGCLIRVWFVFLYLNLFSALSMFHIERRSRNTIIIVIIMITIIIIIIITIVIIIMLIIIMFIIIMFIIIMFIIIFMIISKVTVY